MRRLFFIISLIIWASACKDNRTAPSAESHASADTLPVTMSEEDTAGVPPSSADELFDDFIYSFMSNKRYQAERIAFPLKHTVDARSGTIAQKDWRFDKLFADEDFYVTLFDDAKAMEVDKDTSLNHVTVTWLYFTTKRTKAYTFRREGGKWRLTALTEGALAAQPDYAFWQFYDSFSADEAFQKKHLAEKLTFKYYDYENLQDVEGYIDRQQWLAFRPSLPSKQFVLVNYDQEVGRAPVRYLQISGISNGMASTLKFEWRKGRWLLTAFEN